uniref:Uncharacterized protein n=1 Tax=Hyaloperonospora arabidopsidis (strain Emoy2) TaxID=559515 RepID=M4BNC6_HYAAE
MSPQWKALTRSRSGTSRGASASLAPTSSIYRKPFAPQNYCSPNTSHHASSWATLTVLAEAVKQIYFVSKMKRVNTLHHHLDLATDTLVSSVQPPLPTSSSALVHQKRSTAGQRPRRRCQRGGGWRCDGCRQKDNQQFCSRENGMKLIIKD